MPSSNFKRTSTFRKPSFGRGAPRRDSDGPVEMHQATCSNCNKACEVPFRPNGKKPVFCRDCFNTNRTGEPESRSFAPSRSDDRPKRPERAERQGPDLRSQIELLNTKLDTLTALVKKLVP